MSSSAIDKRYMPRVPASQCSMCGGYQYVGGYECYCFQCIQEMSIAKAMGAGNMDAARTIGLKFHSPRNVTIEGDSTPIDKKRDTHPNKGRLAQ